MKAGWTEKPLGDLIKIQNGFAFKSKQFSVDGEWPLVRIRDLKGNGDTETRYSGEYDEKYIVREGDFLVGMDGEFRCYEWKGPNALLNQRVCRIEDFDGSLDPKFLLYGINAFLKDIEKNTSYTTVKHLSGKKIKSINFPLPPIEEQRRIVAVLDEAFAALDCAQENVETNLEDASALCQAAIDSSLGLENGKRITLSDHLSIKHGFAFKSKDFAVSSDKSLPVVLTPGNYTEVATLNLNTRKTKRLLGTIPNNYLFSKGDLTIVMTDLSSKMKILGQPAFIAGDEQVLHNQRIGKIIFKDEELDPSFLYFLLRATKVRDHVKCTSTGTMVKHTSPTRILSQTVHVPNSKSDQAIIANKLFLISGKAEALVSAFRSKLVKIDNLRQSLLERAFAGELTQTSPSIAINDNERDERRSTATLVLAYEKHRLEHKHKTFGTVKAQKTLHLTESVGGLDLGRQPVVRQAGPHDQEHFARVEAWAVQNDVFHFEQRRRGGQLGHDFIRGTNFDAFLTEAKTLLADYQAGLSRFLPLMTQMNSLEAEVFTTVHAAWNNLLADGKTPSDEDIVWAAREGWHESKLDIERSKFFDAIREIRRHNLKPDGTAKYVHGAQESLL